MNNQLQEIKGKIQELPIALLPYIKQAVLIRKTEEKLLELFSQGKLNGTVHTCVGQELSAVAVLNNLLTDDFIVSNHRGHGHYIARTGDVKGLIAEILGKKSGSAGGIGGSQLRSPVEKRVRIRSRHTCHHWWMRDGALHRRCQNRRCD